MKENIRTYLIYMFLLFGLMLQAEQTEQDSLDETQDEPSIKEFFSDDSKIEDQNIKDFVDILVEERNIPETQEWDTSGINLIRKDYQQRSFDTIKINEFKSLDIFDYSEAKSKDSPFFDWLRRLLARVSRQHDNNTSSNWLSYIIIIPAAILLVWFLLKNEFKSFVKKKDKMDITPKAGDLDITVHEDVLSKNLREAEQEGRYREAIRFQYLIVLKKLNERNIINWKDYKLSQDYIKEIKNQELQKEFSELTNYFNYAWYGNYKVKAALYKKALHHISQIKSEIN